MMPEQLLLLLQEGTFEQNDLTEVFSLGTGLFAVILLVISLISYRKVRLKRFLFVSAAFAAFAFKIVVEQIDLFFPSPVALAWAGTVLIFLDFLILVLIFLSLVKK